MFRCAPFPLTGSANENLALNKEEGRRDIENWTTERRECLEGFENKEELGSLQRSSKGRADYVDRLRAAIAASEPRSEAMSEPSASTATAPGANEAVNPDTGSSSGGGKDREPSEPKVDVGDSVGSSGGRDSSIDSNNPGNGSGKGGDDNQDATNKNNDSGSTGNIATAAATTAATTTNAAGGPAAAAGAAVPSISVAAGAAAVAGVPSSNPLDEGGCFVCKRNNKQDLILLCDGCDGEYHTFCVDPPLRKIPDDEWFCHKCKAAGKGGPKKSK